MTDGQTERELVLTKEKDLVVVNMNLIKPTMFPDRFLFGWSKEWKKQNSNYIVLMFLIFQDYDAQDLSDFEDTILQGVGYDAEGKISRKELTMILLALAKPNEDEQ